MKKKIIILLCLLLLITGCNKKEISSKEKEPDLKNLVETKEEKKEEYVDNNPIKLGIYMYYNSYTDRKKLNEYTTNWALNVDLCSLEIFYTTEESISPTNIKTLWNNYKDNYENVDNYKIGYNISFDTKNEGHINKTILNPNDAWNVYNYMQLYLYDDIHQDGGWYSHVTEEEYNDNTILTSIKLTGSTLTDEITSDITLTAFTYDEDDFDKENNYRGISKDTIIIKRG